MNVNDYSNYSGIYSVFESGFNPFFSAEPPQQTAALERSTPRIYLPDTSDPAEMADRSSATSASRNNTANASWNADGSLTRDTTDTDGTRIHETWTIDGQHTRDTIDAHGNATHDVWTADGTHIRERANADGQRVRDVWDLNGNHLRDAWDENGNHVRDTWDANGKHKHLVWNEKPGGFPPAIGGGGPNAEPTGDGDDDNGPLQRPIVGGNIDAQPETPDNGVNGDQPFSTPLASPYAAPTGAGDFPTAGPTGGTAVPGMVPVGDTPGTGNFTPTGVDDDFPTPDNNVGSTDYDRAQPGPAREPILIGFSPAQRNILTNAYQHTKRMVDAALARLKSGQPGDDFVRWFGSPNRQNMPKVERVLTHIQHAMAHDQFTFVLGAPRDNWELAHVLYNAPHRIDLKPHFFDHAFGANTPEATIAHELSHFPYIGNTKDHLYGPDAVADLAARNTIIATDNAENYGMFIRAQRTA